MTCKHNDCDGRCKYFDDEIERFGYDENGFCICDEDENPLDTCEDFESYDEDEDN